ncbi:MurR/RpiR family transcriptional regulator [Methylovirgula sp. 4M-Z18]|uniref:MurR/RpiR family transcriptional regulator n=1 Tax=Methylovirgula sp. 4M-Z18 TaxID=2293567 RepID=UPI000E2F228A|nr:MurR/RpiR family transcriptional regulator [Methylovirgula sp. 4M-Z18]RFB78441.1 MurR/RpiR family transcriptional regulator [Methylovirgula sp. 4M-Z18]
MIASPLHHQISSALPAMSAQLQAAAQFVLAHPQDVALLSMRELARRAELQPATMTRLAQHLGFAGYDELRDLHAAALRRGTTGFADKVGTQAARQKRKGDHALAADLLDTMRGQIAALAAPEMLDAYVRAAKMLLSARRIFCLGLRSSHAVAWHLHYVLSLIGDRAVLLDGLAGTGADQLRHAKRGDMLFAVSVQPYTGASIDLARYAAGRGVKILALTDHAAAPLATLAAETIVVPTDSPSFFHTMAPAFIVAEILAALVAGRDGTGSLKALRQTDDYFAALDIHLKPRHGNQKS